MQRRQASSTKHEQLAPFESAPKRQKVEANASVDALSQASYWSLYSNPKTERSTRSDETQEGAVQ